MYGEHQICKGCAEERRVLCHTMGQCDELDPFDADADLDDMGIDPGGPDGDPSEAFSEEE